MSIAKNIIKDLLILNRNFCSDDYDKAISYLTKRLPNARVLSFEEGVNGWEIPPRFNILEGRISKDGETIFDVDDNPLKLISLSAPFQGTVSVDDLKEHLHFDTYFPLPENAIPFHFRQNYRPWSRDWGFCVPKEFFDSLEEGQYEVSIRTEESKGELKVIEATKEGTSDLCFVFAAHLDHPGMANDDLAGVAAGVEFFQGLSKRYTKFSYKLLIVQEIIGSEVYLNALDNKEKSKIKAGLFLEMLGSQTPLALQASYAGNSIMDKAAKQALQNLNADFREGAFRSIIGNDEICFEAHNISMPSISRFPYPEYHSSLDNMDIISEEALKQSISFLNELIEVLEKQTFVKKHFEGLICLSNPDYDLYVDVLKDNSLKELRDVMDLIHFINDYTPITELSKSLPETRVREYLREWQEKGLIDLI